MSANPATMRFGLHDHLRGVDWRVATLPGIIIAGMVRRAPAVIFPPVVPPAPSARQDGHTDFAVSPGPRKVTQLREPNGSNGENPDPAKRAGKTMGGASRVWPSGKESRDDTPAAVHPGHSGGGLPHGHRCGPVLSVQSVRRFQWLLSAPDELPLPGVRGKRLS